MKMKVEKSIIAALALILIASAFALAKDKKGKRGMLESMQSVPCGAKERGMTGLGSLFGSVGVEHVNSHEQLCPQYLLRTDEMDYHIRPLDTKHAAVLPVGHEAEFKIEKDRLLLRVADGDKKTRPYQVVSMQPASYDSKVENSAYHPAPKPADSQPPIPSAPYTGSSNPGPANAVPPNPAIPNADQDRATNQTTGRPPQP
ncbi:MAG: hypothetical protein ABSD75_28600 [Terriglobales bacterium]|jgi:hypothetical protein